jgi:hypothetical protein
MLDALDLLVVFCDSSIVRVNGNESKDRADDGDVQEQILRLDHQQLGS